LRTSRSSDLSIRSAGAMGVNAVLLKKTHLELRPPDRLARMAEFMNGCVSQDRKRIRYFSRPEKSRLKVWLARCPRPRRRCTILIYRLRPWVALGGEKRGFPGRSGPPATGFFGIPMSVAHNNPSTPFLRFADHSAAIVMAGSNETTALRINTPFHHKDSAEASRRDKDTKTSAFFRASAGEYFIVHNCKLFSRGGCSIFGL